MSAAERGTMWARLRPLILKSIIAAVIAAAAVGIYAVIIGALGVVEAKILWIVVVFICFAFFALFDAQVVSRRSEPLAIIGLVVALYLLVAGILKVVLADTSEAGGWAVLDAFLQWLGLAVIGRGAVLWAWLLDEERRAFRRRALTRIAVASTAFEAVFAAMLSLPLLLNSSDFPAPYWRTLGVSAILAVLGTALLPLLAWILRRRPATPVVQGPRRLAWPRFEDGTPLPADAEGRPDYSVVEQPPAPQPGA